MKVMWFINNEIPIINNNNFVNEGWISGMISAISENVDDVEITLVYPQSNSKELIKSNISNFKAIGYYRNWNPIKYNEELKKQFMLIINDVKPDVIHVMGTEYPHTYSVCLACKELKKLDRLFISIQGLVSFCAKKYILGIPNNIVHSYTFRDILKGNIYKDQKSFYQRGNYEIMALKIAKNVIGRTEWDYACIKQINNNINYYFNNEVLRNIFYHNRWDYNNCKKNTIFMSQGGYPIKGLHFAFEALRIVKNKYPNVQLRIAGHDIINKPNYKISSYGKYILKLIKKYNLEKNVKFIGLLKEEEILKEYLNANLFISPSTIENSSNSIGEAMLLGMPIISSDVGGVKSFIKHEENGYIYPCTESNMLAYYIMKCLDESEFAKKIANSAREDAIKIYDSKVNALTLIDIYKNI